MLQQSHVPEEVEGRAQPGMAGTPTYPSPRVRTEDVGVQTRSMESCTENEQKPEPDRETWMKELPAEQRRPGCRGSGAVCSETRGQKGGVTQGRRGRGPAHKGRFGLPLTAAAPMPGASPAECMSNKPSGPGGKRR